MSDGSRRVVSITEVSGMEGNIVTLQDLFVFEKARSRSRREGGLGALPPRASVPNSTKNC